MADAGGGEVEICGGRGWLFVRVDVEISGGRG